jgi:hypothetical protein
MTAFTKRACIIALIAFAAILASASAAFAAPLIPAGFGWADGPHGSYPGYCLGCHTGFSAGAAPTITSGATPTHRDRGGTCTQCHTVVTPPPADTTKPVTTSDAKASYTTSATVKLTATDAGSGVASTHYKLDAGADTVGTTVRTSAVGTHTLEFWSVDKAGNVEAHHTVTFSVVAAPVVTPPVVEPPVVQPPVVEPPVVEPPVVQPPVESTPTAGDDAVEHAHDGHHGHHRHHERRDGFERGEWLRMVFTRLHIED